MLTSRSGCKDEPGGRDALNTKQGEGDTGSLASPNLVMRSRRSLAIPTNAAAWNNLREIQANAAERHDDGSY